MNSDHKFRQYTDDEIQKNIKNHYKDMRSKQTLEHVKKMHSLFTNRTKKSIKIMNAINLLETFIDVSDPDISMPNIHHLFQTAEGLRKDNYPDWLQLTGLLHDVGKLLYLFEDKDNGLSIENQWSIVGDTFLVGCQLPESCVYPEFNKLNPDMTNPDYNSSLGIYKPNIGLDNCLCAWGHDEYLYQILMETKHNLPKEALYIIRYHSLYPWHSFDAYQNIENEEDIKMKKIVKTFNKYDLYTKEDMKANVEDLKKYYQSIIDKYFPDDTLLF